MVVLILPSVSHATIQTVTGTTFALTATGDTISTGDGDSMWMWGYALNNGRMQYPGPTLEVNQNATITIVLSNQLPVPTSIVFPGQNVTASGGSPGLLTQEAPPGGNVTYTFVASNPGTYIYYSGTRPDLQIEMGLVGTIIVRPTGFASMNPKQAYGDPSTAYNREYLFFLSEADPVIHQQVALGSPAEIAAGYPSVNTSKRQAVDWFINGRNFPDTRSDPNVDYLPTQPYNCMPMMYPWREGVNKDRWRNQRLPSPPYPRAEPFGDRP
jgi:FtsP/CotA-like multicopper oxidase with cupredoxin domain